MDANQRRKVGVGLRHCTAICLPLYLLLYLPPLISRFGLAFCRSVISSPSLSPSLRSGGTSAGTRGGYVFARRIIFSLSLFLSRQTRLRNGPVRLESRAIQTRYIRPTSHDHACDSSSRSEKGARKRRERKEGRRGGGVDDDKWHWNFTALSCSTRATDCDTDALCN